MFGTRTNPNLARLYGFMAVLFFGCVLAQIFIAGLAVRGENDVWNAHKGWISIFQWLAVLLPITAWYARRRRAQLLLTFVPLVQIGIQYLLAGSGTARNLPVAFGFHAVNGAVLAIVAAVIAKSAVSKRFER